MTSAATSLGWCDGRVVPESELPPFEREGVGVFETVRAEAGALHSLAAHLARFEHGARAVGLPWPPPFEPRAALGALASCGALEPCALRISWTRAPSESRPVLRVRARAILPPPAELALFVAEPGAVAFPHPRGVKSILRAGYDDARARAQAQGAWEVLVRAADGALVEGTITNVFVARAGELATPPLASGALPGTARARVLALLARGPLIDARGRRWSVVERVLAADELLGAEEVLLSNALVGLIGVSRLLGSVPARGALPGSSGALLQALAARLATEAEALRTPLAGDAFRSRKEAPEPGFQGPQPA